MELKLTRYRPIKIIISLLYKPKTQINSKLELLLQNLEFSPIFHKNHDFYTRSASYALTDCNDFGMYR